MGFLPIGHEFRQMEQDEVNERLYGEEKEEVKNDSTADVITILKPVICGAHSLRYYLVDGWNYQSVQHLYEGDIKDFDLDHQRCVEGHFYNSGYYTPLPSAKLKVQEFKAHVSTVKTPDGVVHARLFINLFADYYVEGVV